MSQQKRQSSSKEKPTQEHSESRRENNMTEVVSSKRNPPSGRVQTESSPQSRENQYYLSIKSNVTKRGEPVKLNKTQLENKKDDLILPLDDDEYQNNNSISISTHKKNVENVKSDILKTKLVPLMSMMQSGVNLQGQQRLLKYKFRKVNKINDKSAIN